jgi:NAD(P)-dependent dehydrogenase (short-subunit alcohol dehydrogenase family)
MKSRPKGTLHPRRQPRRARQGVEAAMRPRPRFVDRRYRGAGKLANKVAIITGGDSGIGRAVAVAFAQEGADVVIVYKRHHGDAAETQRAVELRGRRCLTIAGDVGDEAFCREVVKRTVALWRRVDVVVNNAATQTFQKDFLKISAKQLEETFRTNIFAFFYLTRAALPHMPEGSAIVNCTSVTAYRGSAHLVDYSSTKGAIVSFTRSLSAALAEKNIRVNAVAPGPVWTPLITETAEPGQIKTFGSDVPLGRPGQPEEIAPSFVFLASDDASYMTGQVLHPNGGEIVNT